MTTRVTSGGRAGRARVALGCVALALLAGCGAGGKESPEAAATPAPVESSVGATEASTEPTPSETPTDADADADAGETPGEGGADDDEIDQRAKSVVLQEGGPATGEVDLQGAKDVAHTFLGSYFGGLMNNSTHNVEALGSNGCDFCKIAVVEIDDLAAEGLHLAGDFDWEILEAHSGPPVEGVDQHFAMIRYRTGEYRFLDKSGSVVKSEAGGEERVLLLVRLTQSGWVVDALDPVSEEEFQKFLTLMEL